MKAAGSLQQNHGNRQFSAKNRFYFIRDIRQLAAVVGEVQKMTNHGANQPEANGNPVLEALRKGLLLKASLLQYRQRQAGESLPGADALLRAIDDELNMIREMLRSVTEDSVAEARHLEHIRELENRRFELLSLMHGSRLQAYNVPSGRQTHV